MESSTNGKKMFYFFLLFCLLSLSPNQQVAGHCCLPSKYNEQCGTIITLFFYCNDCSIAFPYCEGPGGCNIFGKFFVCCDTFFISFSVHFFELLITFRMQLRWTMSLRHNKAGYNGPLEQLFDT